MNSRKTLHFAIGPVQSFVALARRTRDLWAGSFLLSWLTGHAIHAIGDKGKIIFPQFNENDPLITAIQCKAKGQQPPSLPQVANLPNRFMAEVAVSFDPELCSKAVQDAWQNIAETVYSEYIAPIETLGNGTKEIWDRQVSGFWEILWAEDVTGRDRQILDRRKIWRIHISTVEPGDKCKLTPNFQELSGYIRSRHPGKQDKFWQAVRKRTSYNLQENERLCAIAFVKRMFPLVAASVLGRPVDKSYPSTSSLAIAHWLEEAAANSPHLCKDFGEMAIKLGATTERKIKTTKQLMEKDSRLMEFLSIQSECFFPDSLDNDRLWNEPQSNKDLRNKLVSMLKDFTTDPSPFYAVLLMDGDKMGKLLSNNTDNIGDVSAALNLFSTQVPGIIHDNNGVCVYAGGDDVLGLLPLEDALLAAVALNQCYKKSFAVKDKILGKEQATLSGAIIYAHHHTPLQSVIQEAHQTLDRIAKEKTGRDSLAIKVWKASGHNIMWSAPWEVVTDQKPTIFNQLAENFHKEDKQFTNTFFFNLRRRFEFLAEENSLSKDSVRRLFEAEYIKSSAMEKAKKEDRARLAKENIELLLKICRRSWRENNQVKKWQGELKLDGALLVKFLATKGVGE